jgi:hypothetical protein
MCTKNVKFGNHLEEVYGIVAVDYHRICSPVLLGFLRIKILQDRPISHRKLGLRNTKFIGNSSLSVSLQGLVPRPRR